MTKTCSICKQPLVEGVKVVRVETVTFSAAGTFGTTGWANLEGEFIHLAHVTRAALTTQAIPVKGLL